MTFSSATTSAERASPPNSAISPKVTQDRLRPRAVSSRPPDLHAHAAPRQDKEQLRLVALAHDDLSLLENERVHDGLHQPVFLGIEAFEHIELREREFRLGVLVQHVRQKPILAQFERRIDVAEHAQQAVRLMLGELARDADKRPVISDFGEELARFVLRAWNGQAAGSACRQRYRARCTRLKSTMI